MTYKLLPTGRGVITDRASVFCDVKGSATLSFLLPDGSQYAAVLVDQHGKTYDLLIRNGKIELPQELLTTQTLQLYVVRVDDGRIAATYACESLVVHSMTAARASTFELTGAATEDDIRQRMIKIEEQFCIQVQKCEEYAKQVSELKKMLEKSVAGYNAAVNDINTMRERLDALEADY